MYSIYVDGECIYNDRFPLEEYKIVTPVLKMADSAAGSLEMTLPTINIGYDSIKRMKSTITVKRWDKEIWEGRLVEDSYDFWQNRKVYVEGALAYFNDTCQPQREYTNVTLDQFLNSVIDIHNSKVPDNRKIYFDYQSVNGSIIDYRATQYQKTLEVLNQVCTDYSCHMKVEKKTVNGVYGNYIKFFSGPLTTSTQSVEFGKNLLDYTSNFDMSELATVVVPLGAVKTNSNSSQIGDAIDLTKLKAYTDDDGWGVEQVKTNETVLATQEEVESQKTELIHHYSGWYGYYTAVLLVKGSTTKEKNTVYISSRMHAGFGMYIWQTVSGGGPADSYHSGKYASIPLGFTDIIEEAVEVPVSEDENGRAKLVRLYVGSFGGDVELRVNIASKASGKMDEYYTAEDALVSTISMTPSLPEFQNGNIYTSNEENPGAVYSGSTKTIYSTTDIVKNDQTGFDPGLYSLKAAVTSDRVVQVRVYWYYRTGSFINNSDWLTLPARFTLPEGSTYRLRVVFRYPNSTADFSPTDEITKLDIFKGTRFGSLYVTAESKNLFIDDVEQGGIIESGDNAGLSNSGIDMKRIRSTKPIGVVTTGGEIDGFDVGDYLLHAKTTKTSADDGRVLSVKPFFYDMDDEFSSAGEWVQMDDTVGAVITVPNRGNAYSETNLITALPLFKPTEDSRIIETAYKIDYGVFESNNSYKFESVPKDSAKAFKIRLKVYNRIIDTEHGESTERLIETTEWMASPAEYTFPNDVPTYKIVPELQYTDDSDIYPIDVKEFSCYKNIPLKSKLRFMFKDSTNPETDADIAITALTEIMLEQDATFPSMYEPANSALQEYGWIEKVINFDNVENPDELYYKAKTYLASGQFDKMTLTVKALDLSILGVDTEALDINSYILVNSRPHGLSRFFEITELDIPLAEPENMEFSLGSETKQTLTSINNNTNSDLLAMINSQPSQSSILQEARRNAEAAILDGFTSGSVVTVTNAAGQPTGLGFFKVWNSQTETYDPYTGPYPSAVWDEIRSDPSMADIRCVLINSEGMVFYNEGVGHSSTIDLATGTGQIIAQTGLFETMYADRILGGTLTLGIGGNVEGHIPDGRIYMKYPVPAGKEGCLPWATQADPGNLIEITKGDGIVQQGVSEDGWTRQVKIINGVIEGSIYSDKYHVGGRIYLGHSYGTPTGETIYGMRLQGMDGPLVIAGNIYLDGSIRIGAYGTGDVGVSETVTIPTTDGSIGLRFVNGIFVGRV